MKLREDDTQHIGEVYQLLLGLAGKELLEAVIDPSRQGCVLTYNHLKKSVYTGHPFCLILQWKWERRSGGLRGPPPGGRILRGIPESFVLGLPSLHSDEPPITGRRGHWRCGDGGRHQAPWWQWRQFSLRVVFESLLLFRLDLLLRGGLSKSQRGVSTSLVHSSLSFTTHLHGNWSRSVWWGSLLPL